MRSLILLALMCVCFSHTLAKKDNNECRYSNGKKGYIQTFFMDKKQKIAPFPCTYLLADFWCGEVKANVTILNTAGKEEAFMTRITRLEVGMKYKGRSVSTEMSLPDPSDKQKFFDKMDKKDSYDDLWKIKTYGSKLENGKDFVASYDKKKKAMFVEFEDFRAELRFDKKDGGNKDEVRISCPRTMFGNGTHFPSTLCGHPDDTQNDIDSILPDSSKANRDLDGARWAMAQLTKQNAVQEREYCDVTKDLLAGECRDELRQNVLALCHSYYDTHAGDRYYGGCSRRQPKKGEKDAEAMNPMTLYTYCVNATCHSKEMNRKQNRTWALPDSHCTFLRRVSDKCNNNQAGELPIGTLLDIGGCVGDSRKKD